MKGKFLIIFISFLFSISSLMGISLFSNNDNNDDVVLDIESSNINTYKTCNNCGPEIERLRVVKLKRNSNIKQILKQDLKRFVIQRDFDLQGDTVIIGNYCVLDFRGGCFKNGVIIGQSTKIIYQEKPIFSDIRLKGTWNVPVVSSRMFEDIDKDNVLAQVFNLTDSLIHNKVIIEDGKYYVSVSSNNEGAILPKSNTEIDLNGTIAIRSNPYTHYQIISVMGVKNLYIHGKGMIIGDMYEHEYQDNTSSEWGHGLVIRGSENIFVDGITIKNCTGDCCSVGAIATYDVFKPVPVGTPSYKIELRNCTFEGSRRQGLTIGFATDVIVDSCLFSGIYRTYKGTEPGAGIDIEPDNVGIKTINRGCDVANIVIRNSSFHRLRLGVLAWKTEAADDTRNYKGLRIDNCTFDDMLRNNVFLSGFKDVIVKSCISRNIRWGIGFNNCEESFEVDCKTLD